MSLLATTVTSSPIKSDASIARSASQAVVRAILDFKHAVYLEVFGFQDTASQLFDMESPYLDGQRVLCLRDRVFTSKLKLLTDKLCAMVASAQADTAMAIAVSWNPPAHKSSPLPMQAKTRRRNKWRHCL
ncbi:hypothetical protein P43SY_011230 [Pythium insidiosum]|uniref:Uncharacterized protein n=1 Tax=Pythium insidiosum TaxID=114742 RepID=A0AAD5Q4G0_PYTIN|nr:hypothetical protein P43SY_011230 [Pythium insidiosum]